MMNNSFGIRRPLVASKQAGWSAENEENNIFLKKEAENEGEQEYDEDSHVRKDCIV